MKRTKKYHLFLIILIAIGIVVILFSGIGSPHKNVLIGNDSKVTSIDNWSVSDNKISFTLPENIKDNDVLCFKSDFSFIIVTLDGSQIYSFGDMSEIPFGKSPGSLWNIVSLESNYSGKTITVSSISPYEKYKNNYNPILYGSKKDVWLYIAKFSLPLLLCSLITFSFGVLILLLSFFVYRNSKIISFQSLALLLIITSIWGMSESWFLQFYIGNAFLITQISFVSFFLLPVSTVLSLWELKVFRNRKILNVIFSINSCIFILGVFLQLLNISDFFETLFLVHIGLFISALCYFYDFITGLRKNQFERSDIYAFTAFSLVFLFSAFDLYQFYIHNYYGNGFFYRIGMLLFILFISIWIVKKTLNLHYDNIEKSTYKRIAHTDDLTGIKNRRAFDECLREHELNKDHILIVFIDMDNLKTVNDMKGHAYGDEYLIIAAELIRSFEEKGAICFRIGGDEFCVIGKELYEEDVDKLCEKINHELSNHEELFGIKLSMSYGYSTYNPEKDINIFHCLSRADKAMYINKKS